MVLSHRFEDRRRDSQPCGALPVPVYGLQEAVAEIRLSTEAKLALRLGYIKASSRLPIRLARIPSNLAAKAAQLGNQSHQLLNANLAPGTDIYRFSLLVMLRGQYDRACTIFDIQEFTAGRATTPNLDMIRTRMDRVEAFLDQFWDYMRLLGIERITGTIEIYRKQIDRVEPVLFTIRLRLHQQHLLGDTVSRIGFLRIAVPEVLFAKGHWSKFRIGAYRANCDHFFDFMKPRLLDHLHTHHQVLIEKSAGVGAVRTDTTDYRG